MNCLCCQGGSGEEDPTQTLILGPLTEGKGSQRDQQLRANRLGLAAGAYMLLGAEGVASVAAALGLGVSRSEATAAGLGMSAGDFLEWCN